MNTNKNTTDLKSAARELLIGRYGRYILAFASIQAIIFTFSMIISVLTASQTTISLILKISLTIILELISAVFSLGLIHFTLHISRNQPYSYRDIFYGFSSHPDKAIIAKFLLLAIDLACILPALLFFILYLVSEDAPFLTIPTALLCVIGAAVSIILHLTFDLVFYTLVDYPEASVRELFRYCKDVMRGHRLRYFYLEVSFLPLYLLSLCSFGIGFFFVIPYHNVTVTLFYQDVFYITETADS